MPKMKIPFLQIVAIMGMLMGIQLSIAFYLKVTSHQRLEVELVDVGDYVTVPFQVRRSGLHRISLRAPVAGKPGYVHHASLVDARILHQGAPDKALKKSLVNSYDRVELVAGKKYVFTALVADYAMDSGKARTLQKEGVSEAELYVAEPESEFLRFFGFRL